MGYTKVNSRSSSEERCASDEEGLLKHESHNDGVQKRNHRTYCRSPYAMPTFHIALILLYTLVFFLSYNTVRSSKPAVNLVYSPLNEVLFPEKKTIHTVFGSKNAFQGPPSPELDHAWHGLFVNSNVRVSANDLQKINRTSVPLGDGSGYYAIPGVYHQLHCLKFIRQMHYNDYYHIDSPLNALHFDHCIENLRQNLMCKADVSLETFDWVDNNRAPQPHFDIEHECKNWESIDGWARDHAFDIFNEKTLVHPTLGPSYPEAEFKNKGKIPGHPGFPSEHGVMEE
ncbi:hypothetical protein BDR22DRAFT_887289 [Usnea florida]